MDLETPLVDACERLVKMIYKILLKIIHLGQLSQSHYILFYLFNFDTKNLMSPKSVTLVCQVSCCVSMSYLLTIRCPSKWSTLE